MESFLSIEWILLLNAGALVSPPRSVSDPCSLSAQITEGLHVLLRIADGCITQPWTTILSGGSANSCRHFRLRCQICWA